MAKQLYKLNSNRVSEARATISISKAMRTDMAWWGRHSDVNWSHECRKAIQRKINQLDKER